MAGAALLSEGGIRRHRRPHSKISARAEVVARDCLSKGCVVAAAGSCEYITKLGCWPLHGLHLCLDLCVALQGGLVMQWTCTKGLHSLITPLVTADSSSNISAQEMAAAPGDGANLSAGRDALATSSR